MQEILTPLNITAVNMAKDKIWHEGGIQNYTLYLVVIIAQSIIAWEDIV